MVRGKSSSQRIAAGFFLFMLGVILMVCSLPIFGHTQQEVEQVQKSETIIDHSFAIHQSEDMIVQVQLSIGQSLRIVSEGSGSYSFSVVNFTHSSSTIQPDQPDIIYLSLNNTATINTTWSPQNRIPEPGSYYLVFLARDALPDSPVHVYANVTKTWTDLQFKSVVANDRISLLDQRFEYIGGAIAILGTVVLSVTYSRGRRARLKNRIK